MFWFALGMGLAVVSVGLERRERQPALIRLVASRPLIPWALAFAVYALLTAWLPRYPLYRGEGPTLIVIHLAFGVIAALLLLPAVFGDRSGGLPRRFLAHPVVAWLGLISYGIFLWHYVVTRHLGGAGANLDPGLLLIGTLAITIPCAAASYYLVERPLLRLKYRRLRDVVGYVRGVRRPSPAPQRVRSALPTITQSEGLDRLAADRVRDPEPGEDRMRHTFAVPIVTLALVASLLAGCGDDDGSNGNTTDCDHRRQPGLREHLEHAVGSQRFQAARSEHCLGERGEAGNFHPGHERESSLVGSF